MTENMKAVFIRKHGGLEVLEWGDQPIPHVREREVLIKLKAAALNHLDIWVRMGIPGIHPPLPHILGSDGAGEVVAVGAKVKNWKPGDEVVFNPGVSCDSCPTCLSGKQSLCLEFSVLGEHIPGTFAQYVCIPEINVYKKPEKLSWQEAAAFPLVFVTAWRMLITRACLKPGETVLIPGIGGGVALAALAICRFLGCTTIVTSSSQDKLKKAEALGASLGIQYGKEDVVAIVRNFTQKRGVDVVCETVGGEQWKKSLQCLAKGGRLVTCGCTAGPNPSAEIPRIFGNQITILGSTMGSHQDFSEVYRLIANDSLRPVIDSVYPLADIKKAQERMENKEHFGKIVLEM